MAVTLNLAYSIAERIDQVSGQRSVADQARVGVGLRKYARSQAESRNQRPLADRWHVDLLSRKRERESGAEGRFKEREDEGVWWGEWHCRLDVQY